MIHDEFIESKISRHNLQKMRLLCKITSVILIGIIGIKSLQLIVFDQFHFVEYLDLSSLFLILATNGVFLYYSSFYYKKSTYSPIPICRLTNMYVFSLLFVGVIVSISNSEMFNQLMLYSLILIVASSYFIIQKKYLILSVCVNSITLIIGLYMQQGYSDQFQKQLLYILGLIPIAIYISSAFHRSYMNTLQVQVRLMSEIKSNRKLANELSELNDRLSLQASIDPMTGLFNRGALNEYIVDIASKAEQEPVHLTVIMLDVDYFKRYNDFYGHIEGDKVLIKVAEVLQEVTEEHGIFTARYGGEEFTLVLLGASEEMVETVCKDIVTKVKKLQIAHADSASAPYVTVSVGAYSKLAESGTVVNDILEQADRVLYDVKNKGRNGFGMNYQSFTNTDQYLLCEKE